jgi:thiol-disulfide isomerase/thioredoxin
MGNTSTIPTTPSSQNKLDKDEFLPEIHLTGNQNFRIENNGKVFLIPTEENNNGTKMTRGIVVFYAPWCHYCKEFAPMCNQYAKDFKGCSFNFKAVDCTDTENNGTLTTALNIRSYPTLKYIDPATQEVRPLNIRRTKEDFGQFLRQQNMIN